MQSVLLIDDDRVFQSTLATWLEEEGWQVLTADDGDIGLDLAQKNRPTIVICDLLMPRRNGFEVCRNIRAHPELYGYPKIIVTTGSSYASDQQNALQAGADEYWVKPIQPQELSKSLARLTQRGAEPAPSPSAPPVEPSPFTRIKFWGVRGSIPTPGPSTVFYGGNTACIEVRSADQIIILDAGTGLRPLGLKLAAEFQDRPIAATLLITHTHWDHIQGFPFFLPAYNPKNMLRILGFDGARKGLERTFSSQMESPYFPISLEQMPGNILIDELRDLSFSIGHVSVQATFLNHPGICVGYRLFTPAGSIAYLPDNELFQRLRTGNTDQFRKPGTRVEEFAQSQDQKIAEFVKNADVLIIDSQYDASEYASHVGWGHSCSDDTVALAIQSNVKRLFLFHHDPNHDDEHISRMVTAAKELAARQGAALEVEAAREGLEIVLPG